MCVCYSDDDYCTKACETFKMHHILTSALISMYYFWRKDFVYNKWNEDTELFGIHDSWTGSFSPLGWNLSPLPPPVWSAILCHCLKLCKFRGCRTSQYVCSHGWNGTGLGSCGICGPTHMEVGLGSRLLPCLPQWVEVCDYCGPGTWLWWTCTSWSVLVGLWTQHLRDTRADCLHFHSWGGAECSAKNSVLYEPTQWVTPQSAFPCRQLWQRNPQWLLSQEEYSNTTYLTQQLRNGSGGFYCNDWGPDPAPNRTVTTTEQREVPTQYPVQTLVTTTPVTPPIKVIMTSTHWGETWQASILKTALAPKILNSCRLNRDALI